ncbi:acyltransferase domain-containing protein [uncultured Desulfovibrio sp.]|uniref:acyltransferase domain-containing protein n=1 Tax=uncultured Desulfovibrio sp. TaxID=167968 RepID=UPI00260E9942|nr:acyltransferase domain-containing protein [uncultured Desulfovibrio sp.]
MRQDYENPVSGNLQDEIVLDGVRYANLQQAGQQWRIGAVNPAWRQELLALPANPDAEALARLEARGLWIAPERADGPPPLAVMCCGLGAVWPGMGRELYDNFPAARAAMDRIAAVADWDILGLMDETGVEKISLTRWQSPYVFMLEYAQWSVLSSLGLSPSLFCGHSLGEMIALCFSGILAPEVAWYILDTRAVHMSELEAGASRETGMMAVHADAEIINEACATWPALYVSNYNTPHQFILSGPRGVLQEARKSLRKRRIPAIVLNVSLAFHHPSMRVLRDISLRRLSALDMSAPERPMLSGITADFYPEDQPSICQYIADLDENSVRWTECVQTMWDREGIRYFLELGPQDTLCSLAADNEPQAKCLTAGRKGKEVEGMRQACAHLYSLGYLRRDAVARRARQAASGGEARMLACKPAPHCGLRPAVAGNGANVCASAASEAPQSSVMETANAEFADSAAAAADSAPVTASHAESMAVVLQILAQACGRPVEDLRPEMDLRYDLALRSSRFPHIVQDVEKALGITVNFEDLLQVSTIGDLGRVLSGGSAFAGQAEHTAERASATAKLCAEPLRRFAPLKALPPDGCNRDLRLEPLPLDPSASGINLQPGDAVLLCVLDAYILPRLLSGIAPLGCVLGVPQPLLERCAPLAKAGARLMPLDIDLGKGGETALVASQLQAAVADFAQAQGRVDGLFFVPPVPAGIMVAPSADDVPPQAAPERLGALMESAIAAAVPHGLRFVGSCSVLPPEAKNCIFDAPLEKAMDAAAHAHGVAARAIRMLHGPERASLDEWGDMLAREILCGTAEQVIWVRPGAIDGPVVCEEPPVRDIIKENPLRFPLVFPEPQPAYRSTATLFQGGCHFSHFADKTLALHGAQQDNCLGSDVPRLPVCRSLEAMLESSRQALPWLTVTGFCDLRFFDAPELPSGTTRECRVTAEAEPWLMQEKVMTRMCRSELAVRGLTPNGRHTAQYAPVSEGMVWLAAHRSSVRPLWEEVPAAASVASPVLDTGPFYKAAGLGREWRIVENFCTLPDDLFSGALSLPQTCIAPGADSGYTGDMLVVEGVLQAAWLAITSEYSKDFSDTAALAAAMQEWALHAVGFIRIGPIRADGPLRILMQRSWANARLRRFDAQVIDQEGHVFLTIHHLEFDRCDQAGLSPAVNPSA